MTQGRMESAGRGGPHIEKVLEKLLRTLSMWVIPLAIVLFSLLALSAWDDRYSSEPLQQLEFQALLDESRGLTAKEALARLATEKTRQQYETRLSEAPVWFRIPLDPPISGTDWVEIPSRHLKEIACWDTQADRLLGQVGSGEVSGEIRKIKSGYALQAQSIRSGILCRASFQGPARLTALLWSDHGLSNRLRSQVP